MVRSRLYLPKTDSPPRNLLEHLAAEFPHVPLAVWKDRFDRGLIKESGGQVLLADAGYHQGWTVFYEREVPEEPEPDGVEHVVYRDDLILVADKPHGMPVTPGIDYVARSLLVRLTEAYGLSDLAPAHRLDRDTAGLVLFTVDVATRARYHGLFAKKTIEREYLAVAHWCDAVGRGPWLVENRIAAGEPWFVQRVVEGPPNAATEIELIETHREKALFRLRPRTGKKHQLRVHMASIGAPIVGDPLYDEVGAPDEGVPLQLLARRLSFADPVTGAMRNFTSLRSLSWSQ